MVAYRFRRCKGEGTPGSLFLLDLFDTEGFVY